MGALAIDGPSEALKMVQSRNRRLASADGNGEPQGSPTSHDPEVDAPGDEANGPVGEFLRRATALGLSGFFSTEGAIRRAFGDTVPQEWVDFVTDQSERSRQELFDRDRSEDSSGTPPLGEPPGR